MVSYIKANPYKPEVKSVLQKFNEDADSFFADTKKLNVVQGIRSEM